MTPEKAFWLWYDAVARAAATIASANVSLLYVLTRGR